MREDPEQQIAAFSDLLAQSRSRLFGYIYAMLHSMSDAEDVYQQTTVVLWDKFAEFEKGTDFTSWAIRVACFNIKNFQRSQRRSRVFFSDAVMERVADSFVSKAAPKANERTEALVVCLDRLPEAKRSLLQRRYADGMSLQALAREEQKSEAALSMVLLRVRKILMACINDRLAIQ